MAIIANMGKRLRQVIGDRLGAEIAEFNIEKAIEAARDRVAVNAPKAMFYDPLSLFMGVEWLQKKPGSLSYRDLRAMARNPIIHSIIQTRMNQMAMFCYPQREAYDLGFRITSDDPVGNKDTETKEAITQFIYKSGIVGYGESSLEVWMRKFIRDSLVLDQACSEIVYRRNGTPAYMVVVDGATIRRMRASLEYALPPDNEPYYVQIREHFQVIVAEYQVHELIFGVRNPQTDIFQLGYGLPELETLLRIVTTLANAEKFNTNMMAQGGTRKGLLVVSTDSKIPEFEQFKRDFRMAIQAASSYWRPPVLQVSKDSKLDWVALDNLNRDMEYAQLFDFLIKQACGVYQISPEEINWTIGQVGTSVNFAARGDQKVYQSQRRGLKPLLNFTQTLLSTNVVQRIDPRFRLEFVGLERDKQIDVELRIKEVQNYRTVNEIRAEMNLDPLEGGDILLNAIFFQNLQIGMNQSAGMQDLGPEPPPYEPVQGEGPEVPTEEGLSQESEEGSSFGDEGPPFTDEGESIR